MEIEHVEHVMAVPVFGLACLSLFVLLFLAGAIGGLVVLIKLISGPVPSQSSLPARHEPRQTLPIFKGLAIGLLVLIMLAGLMVTGVRTVAVPQQQATIDMSQELLRHNQELARIRAEEARDQAEAARQRGMQSPLPAITPAPPNFVTPTSASPQPPIPPTPAKPDPVPASAFPEPVSAVQAVAVAQTPAATEPPISDRTTPVENAPTTTPPEWIKAGTKTIGERQFLVISSKQYATEAEARADADQQVIAMLRKDLRQYTNQMLIHPDESVGLQESMKIAIRERYTETLSRDFGSFFAPMYRMWYQVELSPAVREPALLRWRAVLVESRIVFSAGAVLALLCVPLAVVTFWTCNRRTGGRARGVLATGCTAAVVAVWLAVGLFFARHFVLWG